MSADRLRASRRGVGWRAAHIATSIPANASSPANISPVGPPPATTTACSAIRHPHPRRFRFRLETLQHDPGLPKTEGRRPDKQPMTKRIVLLTAACIAALVAVLPATAKTPPPNLVAKVGIEVAKLGLATGDIDTATSKCTSKACLSKSYTAFYKQAHVLDGALQTLWNAAGQSGPCATAVVECRRRLRLSHRRLPQPRSRDAEERQVGCNEGLRTDPDQDSPSDRNHQLVQDQVPLDTGRCAGGRRPCAASLRMNERSGAPYAGDTAGLVASMRSPAAAAWRIGADGLKPFNVQ